MGGGSQAWWQFCLSGEHEEAHRTLLDQQWKRIEPLLLPHGHVGRPRVEDRKVIAGILYVLRTGCRWQDTPREHGAYVTAWRGLRRWEDEGIGERIWQALLGELDEQEKLEWARAGHTQRVARKGCALEPRRASCAYNGTLDTRGAPADLGFAERRVPMPSLLPAVLIALVGGVAICLQSLFSGVIGTRVGVAESTFIVHVGGVLLSGAIIVFLRGGNLGAWHSVPWYALTAGFLGVLIVTSVSYAVPRLGLASTLTLTIAAQLLVGVVLDHFGWLGAVPRPLDLARVIGLLVLGAGTWLVIR